MKRLKVQLQYLNNAKLYLNRTGLDSFLTEFVGNIHHAAVSRNGCNTNRGNWIYGIRIKFNAKVTIAPIMEM
jgi:hypothetical protein